MGEGRRGKKKLMEGSGGCFWEKSPPLSPCTLETFHLVETEIWFQGSAGNLWLSKKKKKDTFPSLSLLSPPATPPPHHCWIKFHSKCFSVWTRLMTPMNICCFQRKLSACVKPLTSRIKVTLLAPKGGFGAFHTPGCQHSFAGGATAGLSVLP